MLVEMHSCEELVRRTWEFYLNNFEIVLDFNVIFRDFGSLFSFTRICNKFYLRTYVGMVLCGF